MGRVFFSLLFFLLLLDMLKSNNLLIISRIALALSVAVVQGCKKPEDDINRLISSCALPPAPVVMVPLNKQGTNLITSTTDKVVISYNQNGQTQLVSCVIDTITDATTHRRTTKYGGLAIGCALGSYSYNKSSPVKTFQLLVNSQPAGTIFYDLRDDPNRTSTGVQNCYKLFSFTLNGVAVQTDATVMPDVNVLHCNL